MRKRKILFVLLVIFCLVSLYVVDKSIQKTLSFLKKSDFLKIDQIEISGNSRLDKSRILHLSGLKIGMNILDIDKKQIQDRLDFPCIEECSIKRKFPNKLYIKIKEREAVAICHNSESYLIDKNGYLIERLEQNQRDDLSVIEISNKIDPNEEQPLEQAKLGLKILFYINKIYPKILFGPINIELTEDESVVIKADSYLKKIFISIKDMERKMDFLLQLLPDIKKRCERLDYVDLRFDDLVIINPLIEHKSL